MELTLSFYQHYWWFLVALLGALLTLLTFVQGGQILLYRLGKTAEERSLLATALGRKWELTFTTLVTFGGAVFAAFPMLYATMFSGAYWLWMSILFCFVIQAVSYEYRSKASNFLGQRVYDAFLWINGACGLFLLGIALAKIFNGAAFEISYKALGSTNVQTQALISNLDASWLSSLSWINVLLGLTLVFLAMVLGILYMINHVDHPKIIERARRSLLGVSIPFVVFFLGFMGCLLTQTQQRYSTDSLHFFKVEYGYWQTLIEMPYLLITLLIGVALVLWGIAVSLIKNSSKGIWFTGLGSVLTVLIIFLIGGWNQACIYPNQIMDGIGSLHVGNASSSLYTLRVMSIVSLVIPIVVAYIAWAWYQMNRKKIDLQELNESDHKY